MEQQTYTKLEILLKNSSGYVGTRDLLQEGFTTRQIAALTKEEYLEKVCFGWYWIKAGNKEKPADYKCVEIALTDPNAVICMESALYYQGILKEEPESITVATERTDRRKLQMNFPVKRRYFSGTNFKQGRKKVETAFGSYYIYDVERCIYDLQRLKSDVLPQIGKEIRKEQQHCNNQVSFG
jgi:predicted transcriptional regulator of viral defense system